MTADRYNTGKPRFSLIDFKSLTNLVRVLEFGMKKYSRDNWKKGLPVSEIIDSLLRHVVDLQSGKYIDEESGIPVTGHIQANAMFLDYMLENKLEFVDFKELHAEVLKYKIDATYEKSSSGLSDKDKKLG